MLRYRGRTGLTQREVAQRLGAHVRSIQVWESGTSYPSSASLQALIAGYLEAGGFEAGHEAAEAEALWTAALREAPRLRPPFDAAWFAGLLAGRRHAPSAEHVSALGPLHEDWGEAPDTVDFLGRTTEVGVLQRWVVEERCRVVALLGLGGIGKTTLAARLARELAPAFERVYWRSVRNALTLLDWLGGAIGFLSGRPFAPAEPESARMTMLLELLRRQRCLLILDNLETLLQPGLRESEYREGYANYGRLLEVLAEANHQSCLVVTSREAPPELGLRAGEHAAVRVMELAGLEIADGQALLREKGLRGDPAAWESLVARYGGNSLALKMVGESIRQVFGGEIDGFLGQVGFRTVFGSIRRLIDAHVERLSTLERDVLQCLALEREPVTFAELVVDLGPRAGPVEVLEAIEALRRRSLIERNEVGATFTPQSVVLEYMTDRLAEQLADELARGRTTILKSYPLIKAQAKDYIRRGQERLLVAPVLERLIAACGGQQAAEQRLLSLLDELRERSMVEHGYAPGNLINLMRVQRGDLRGLDLSRLEIRQAFLQEVEAQDTTLAGSHLTESVLAASFHYPACMALSADGSRLAVGTPTGEVCVWQVSDRKLLVSLQGHTGAVRGVAVSDDGQLLASGSQDGTIRLWSLADERVGQQTMLGMTDTESRGSVLTLDGDIGVVWSVALSGEGTLLAGGCEDGTIKLWETQFGSPSARGGQLLRTLAAHTGRVRGVAVSRDGQLLASGGSDGSVALWEAATGRRLASLIEHGGEVWTVAVSANGRLAASAGLDGAVRVWDIGTVRLLMTLQGHSGGVWDVALSADGALVASGGVDGTVKVWDTSSGRQLATLHGHSAAVRGVALSGDAQLVASGNEDGTVRLWEAASGRLLATLQGHSGGVTSVALSPDGQVVARSSVDGTVRLWEVTTGHPLVTLTGHTAGVCAVALNAEAQLVVSGNADGTVKVWQSATGRLLTTLGAHAEGVRGVALSSDGGLLATGSFDGSVKLWEAGTWRLINTLEGHTGGVRNVALSHDGQLLAAGSVDGIVTVWEVRGAHVLTTVPGHAGGVSGVALDKDARLVASSGADGAVRLSDARTGRKLTGLQVDAGGVNDVALSGDGQLVASGCGDGTVRLDSRSGQLRLKVQADNVGVWSVALTDDGQLLASGSADGTTRVWNTTTGACLRTLRADRHYERLDITGLTGVSDTQRAALLALGAVEQTPRPAPG